MEWYGYAIIIMGVMLFFLVVAFFLARHAIKLRLKAFLGRRDSTLMVELAKNRRLNMSVCKVSDNRSQFKNKTYGIDDTDVCLSPEFGIPAVVVNENSAKSIGVHSSPESTLSPTVIDDIIKRVKAAAAGELYKIFKYAFIAFACVGFVLIVQCFILFRFYAALQSAGVSINF